MHKKVVINRALVLLTLCFVLPHGPPATGAASQPGGLQPGHSRGVLRPWDPTLLGAVTGPWIRKSHDNTSHAGGYPLIQDNGTEVLHQPAIAAAIASVAQPQAPAPAWVGALQGATTAGGAPPAVVARAPCRLCTDSGGSQGWSASKPERSPHATNGTTACAQA